MRARCCISLVAMAAISSCTPYLPRYPLPPNASPTGFYEDPLRPDLALLEHTIAKYLADADHPYRVLCAAGDDTRPADNEASRPVQPAVEVRLLARFPQLSPRADCRQDGLVYYHRTSGAEAAIFDVHDLECAKPTRCLAWGGYQASGPHGWMRYHVDFIRGAWRIRPKKSDIVLTGQASATPDKGL